MSVPKLVDDRDRTGYISPPYDGAQYVMDNEDYFAGDGTYLFSEKDGKRSKKGGKDAPEVQTGTVVKGSQSGKTDGKRVDLVAWLKGEKKYGYFAARDAAAQAFPDMGVSQSTKKPELVAGLVQRGVVTFDEVKI